MFLYYWNDIREMRHYYKCKKCNHTIWVADRYLIVEPYYVLHEECDVCNSIKIDNLEMMDWL